MLARHNEHIIFPTKALIWLLYQWNGWNLVTLQLINFLVFISILGCLVWISRRASPQLMLPIVIGFCLFLLSTLPHDNHLWGLQSSFHFFLLFYFLAIALLFIGNPTGPRFFFGALCAVLSAYSLASGAASLVVVFLAFPCYQFLRFRGLPSEKKFGFVVRSLFVVLVLGAALFFWLITYHKHPGHPNAVLPYRPLFWYFLVNLVSFGFGVESRSALLGLVCFGFVVIPMLGILCKRDSTLLLRSFPIIVASIGLLASLASITIGRAGFSSTASKWSRYGEISMMLVPLSVSAWANWLKDRPVMLKRILISAWLFCFVSFADDWGLKPYRMTRSSRIQGLDCLRSYYAGKGDGFCKSIYPQPLGNRLEVARALQLSFLSQVTTPSR